MTQTTPQIQNQQDDQLDLIARTVVNHTGQLDQHKKTLDQHTKTLKQHTVQLDRITHAVLRNTVDIEWIKDNMAKKEDIDNLSDTLDEILGLVKKKDQELTFLGQRVKRVENDVAKIKPLVGLT